MQQRIAFLYLNTGGGHLAPARALATALQNKYPKADSTFLVNGFSEKMKLSRFFFERGYSFSANLFEPGYVCLFRMGESPVIIRLGYWCISTHGVSHLARFFRDNRITKVVCLHSVLILLARAAIDRVNPDIPLITIVTDPFTAHALWFYEKKTEFVVFSEKVRREAITKHGVSEKNVHAFPFIFSSAYNHPYTEAEISDAKRRYNLPEKGKVLLIAGGGEGLRGAERVVADFVRRDRPETLIVVCGRNRILKHLIEKIVERSGATNVKIFGFVSFMPDLLNVADCVITKGGASTVMETLAVGKPVIFSTFIRGQELGNVLYAVYGGAGWYIREPAAILDRAVELVENPHLAEKVRRNIANLGIRNGLNDVAEFIHELPAPLGKK